MKIIVQIKANIAWKACRDEECGIWIAICEPLGVTAQGETWAELSETIAEALDAMLHDLLGRNDLDKFLQAHGWKLINALPERHSRIQFDVPFTLQPQNSKRHDPAAALC